MAGLRIVKKNRKSKNRAVVTILGVIGHTYPDYYIQNNEIKTRFKEKPNNEFAQYTIDNKLDINLNNRKYINMFHLITSEKQFDSYDIIALGTEQSIKIQKDVLDYTHIKRDINYKIIPNEQDYLKIFKLVNQVISNKEYDEIIFDVSHGFRHLPILATVSLIIQNIKTTNKVDKILFAKEIIKNKEYEIVNLKEFLDIANLSFIIANFQDNYTISRHIATKNEEYNNLITAMNRFSNDVMSLSLENLLDNTSKKLIDAINNIIKQDNTILHNELQELKEHIENTFKKRESRYLTYYYLAKNFYQIDKDGSRKRGYLVHALALVFEAIGFYLKSRFELYSPNLKRFIEEKENEIKSSKRLDYYKLTDACRSFLFFDKNTNKNNFFNKKYINLIYNKLSTCSQINKFKQFASRVKKLRNNLLHANSSNKLNDTDNDINEILKDFRKYCIDEDILNLTPKVSTAIQYKTNKLKKQIQPIQQKEKDKKNNSNTRG